MRIGGHGELLPVKGFSRYHAGSFERSSAWLSHDGIVVISSLEQAQLPRQPDGVEGPQWLVSCSHRTGTREARRCTDDEVMRVVEGFAMPAFESDAHHPGAARHLWCPVNEDHRVACECKLDEVVVIEPDGYEWTNDPDPGKCRGCELEAWAILQDTLLHTGLMPCPIHGGKS